jgi:hypothetical protein
MKMALKKSAQEDFGRELPVAGISPRAIDDVKSLSIPVPPILKEALGYRGTLRFVEFGYSTGTHIFRYCDGGDHIPTNSDLWIQSLRHPGLLPLIYRKVGIPLFHGVFPRNQQRPVEQL